MKTYKVNEIFHSIQGEGYHAGTAMVFVRFSGCNLSCDFCDTDFSKYTEMTEKEIWTEVKKYNSKWTVFTGGEPFLHLDEELLDPISLGGRFHAGKIAVETNGTVAALPILRYLDWITVSPKHEPLKLKKINEIKVLIDNSGWCLLPEGGFEKYPYLCDVSFKYIQPIDDGNKLNSPSVEKAIEFVKRNTDWKLSIQLHKVLGVR